MSEGYQPKHAAPARDEAFRFPPISNAQKIEALVECGEAATRNEACAMLVDMGEIDAD